MQGRYIVHLNLLSASLTGVYFIDFLLLYPDSNFPAVTV